MKKTLTTHIIAIFAGIGLLLGSAGVMVAQAQTTIPLQVAPARQEISVDPGEQATIRFTFFNLGDVPLAGRFSVADFVVDNEFGTPRLIDDATQASPRFAGSQWIELPLDRAAIAANSKVDVQATFTVPQDARPGGRYVAIYFEPESNFSTSGGTATPVAGAAVQSRIAGLVYIRVNGPITEKAQVSQLFAPSFHEYGPITFRADILNRGDYHIRPQGTLTLKNMFGGLVDQKRLEEVNIFPDAVRSFEGELGSKWMFGKYNMSIVASYGESGQIIERSIGVWVFPWKITLAILGLILLVLFIGKKGYDNLINRDSALAEQLKREHEEVEKLREELKNRK